MFAPESSNTRKCECGPGTGLETMSEKEIKMARVANVGFLLADVRNLVEESSS